MSEERARALVRERSAGQCELCRVNRATDWAHRRNRSHGGQWKASNGLDLCRPCHMWTEHHPTWAYQGGWRIDVAVDPDTVPVWLNPRLAWAGWWLLGDDGVYYPVDQGDPPWLPEWAEVPSGPLS